MACVYTVYKCKSKSSDKRVGALHYSDDGNMTLCGEVLDEKWYIADNTFTGVATCKECLRIDRDTDLIQRAKDKSYELL